MGFKKRRFNFVHVDALLTIKNKHRIHIKQSSKPQFCKAFTKITEAFSTQLRLNLLRKAST
jgi:hypothetical protein